MPSPASGAGALLLGPLVAMLLWRGSFAAPLAIVEEVLVVVEMLNGGSTECLNSTSAPCVLLQGWEPPWDCSSLPGGQCVSEGHIISYAPNGDRFWSWYNRLHPDPGTIPSTISRLSLLSELHLNFFARNGSIPWTLGTLTNLVSLQLGYNDLEGPIPASLSKLSSLTRLDLSGNRIGGSIGWFLESFPSLVRLDLSNNKLEGPLPGTAALRPSLQEINLNTNRITGSIPETWENLSNLLTLDVGSNQLEGSLPASLSQLSLLEVLDLSGNGISGSIPSTLGNLSRLSELRLDRNRLSGSWKAGTSNLRRLILGRNQLEASFLLYLAQMYYLQELDLSNNRLSGDIPATLGVLGNLTSLSLQHNQLEGPIPGWISQLSLLQALNLSNNSLNGSIPDSLRSLRSLTLLGLASNRLEGAVSPLGVVAGLKELNLSLNSFADKLSALVGLTALQLLDITGNRLSGDIPDGIISLRKLSALGLAGNIFSKPQNLDEALQMLRPWAALAHLSLSSGQAGDVIPDFISYFASLSYLKLTAPRFSGAVPGEWSSFKALEVLILEGEGLGGSLPESLALLGSLTLLQVPSTVQCPLPPCAAAQPFKVSPVCSRCTEYCQTCPAVDVASLNATVIPALLRFQEVHRVPGTWTASYLPGVEIQDGRVTSISINAKGVSWGSSLDLSRLWDFRDSLTSLVLSDINTVDNLDFVDHMTSLQRLELRGVQVLSAFWYPLWNLTELTRVHLSTSSCDPTLGSWRFVDLPNLSFLKLSCDNTLRPSDVSRLTIGDWEHLRHLDLAGPSTVGPIVGYISLLTELSLLDLRGANLGPLPVELGEIPLRHLDLDSANYSCPTKETWGCRNTRNPVYKDLPFCSIYCKDYCDSCPGVADPSSSQPRFPQVVLALAVSGFLTLL